MATTLTPPRHNRAADVATEIAETNPSTALVIDRSFRPAETPPAKPRSALAVWLSDLLRRPSSTHPSLRDAVLLDIEITHNVRSIQR